MMFWTWIFVLFAVAMVLGPVMMLRPTRGTARLAAIRAAANASGISVRLPTTAERPATLERRGAFYSLRIDKYPGDDAKLKSWAIDRKGFEHGIHFYKGWDFRSDSRVDPAGEAPLKSFLSTLPEGVHAVAVRGGEVALLWDEKLGKSEAIEVVVDQLRRILETLREDPQLVVFTRPKSVLKK